MGGQIDWGALPILVGMFGVDDVEALVNDLVTVRDALRRERDRK